MRFSQRTVVVTGAASGIGAATARLFAREGARVVAADRDEEGGARLLADLGGDALFVPCDVTDTAAIRALMDEAARFGGGGIDTVFNNAGAGGARASIAAIEPDEWDATLALLLRSVAFGIRYAVPHMKGRAGASIVNTASVAAIGPGYAPTAYSVAKAGVLQLTRCAATDLAADAIRVNAVQPGFINTNIFTAQLALDPAAETAAKAAIARMSAGAQPVARGGQAEDIARAVAYLASDDAAFVTGQGLVVDGGMTVGPRHSWDPATPDLFERLEALKAGAAG